MAYNNNMSGVAYKNDYKKKDNQPDYRGKLEIDGVKYEQAIWIRVDREGKKYFSFSYSLPREKDQSKSAPSIEEVKEEMDDFVPF